jgi:hypothetical protein
MPNTIIFKRDYESNQVTINEVKSTRLIDQQLENDCAVEWQRNLKEAAETNKDVWDSEIYRFEGVQEDEGLNLTLSTVPFSVRRPMNKFTERIVELGLDYSAKGMYSSCFVITCDGNYVFTEDGGKYLNRRKYMFIGGVLSKSEKELQTGEDLFGEAQKECFEEAGCWPEDIESTILNAGFITDSCNICLIFTMTLNLTFPQLVERFNQKNDGEAKALVCVEAHEISDFARRLDEKEHPKFIVKGLL